MHCRHLLNGPRIFGSTRPLFHGLSTEVKNIFFNGKIKVGVDKIRPADEYRAWEAEAAVRLRVAASGPGAIQPVSVPTLLRHQVTQPTPAAS